jgi:hypothetical protein
MINSTNCIATQQEQKQQQQQQQQRVYDTHVDKCGRKVFTVRRYNRRVLDYARIREKMLKKIVANNDLVYDDNNDDNNGGFNLQPIHSKCVRCKKNFTLYAAVTYLPCGHSCLCGDCDDLNDTNTTCVQCNNIISFKLIYNKN